MVLGTVGYMAPEQVRGEAADQRADIFALGCMLHEMAAGRRAFDAPTTAETMTAILKEDPPELPMDRVPPGLARVIHRCLEKNPAARFKAADDLAFALEALSSVSMSASSVLRRGDAPSVLQHARVAWTITAIAGAVTAALLARSVTGPADDALDTTRLELMLPVGVELLPIHGAAAVAVDGRQVAFIGILGGVRQVYVRRFDQFVATPVRGTDGAVVCFFAPDDSAVGFIDAGGVVGKVSLIDGSVARLADGADYTFPAGWGADGRITFTRGGALWQVPASGGSAVQLTTLDASRQEVLHGLPIPLGDGRVVVFGSAGFGNTGRIEALMPSGAGRRVLIDAGGFPLAAGNGRLIFFRDGTLFAAPFDAEHVEVTGAATRVVENVAVDGLGMPMAAVTDSGTLVYQARDSAAAQLVWVSHDGVVKPVTEQLRPYGHPRLSPDGRRLLVDASGQLWVLDTTRSTFTPLMAAQPAANTFPVWMPDGTRIVFKTRTNLRWLNADGSGQPQDIPGTLASDFPSSISPDGQLLAFARISQDTALDVYMVALDGTEEPRPVVKTVATEGGPQFSPDGRWLAYVSTDTGQMQIYLRPVAGSDRRWQVSTDGGTSPRWSRSGRELFYRSGDRMMVVDVVQGAEPELSRPRMLFEQRYTYGTTITLPNYDVRPDGQGFVMVREPAQAARLNVVLNWFGELARLSPVGNP
jgi:serine/threonine-protein kinase